MVEREGGRKEGGGRGGERGRIWGGEGREERRKDGMGGVGAIVVEPGESGRKMEEDEGYVEEEEGEGRT